MLLYLCSSFEFWRTPFPAKFIIGNLGQACGKYPIYPQNLGWLAKSKIPDRLGFSQHMKTRLYMAKSCPA